jgi:membrane protein implicated in regulation of membrane protease activity
MPSASLPWVATVLGVHWLVFRMVFQEEVFLWLGWFTLSCGVVGLMVALTGVAEENALAATAITSGLIVGVVMLGAVWVDARRRRDALLIRRARQRPPGRST